MENKTIVTINGNIFDELKKKYPSVNFKEIEKWALKKCRFYSNLEQEDLEAKYSFEKGSKNEWNEIIKDFVTLIQYDYNKDIKKLEEDMNENLFIAYENIIKILHNYCDLKEEYYNIIALWIIGTYFHDDFPTYPYLFLNATKGSGKTRLLKLITKLSKDGEILNSLTEAVLFRTKGTLAIDEFEGVVRKGKETLLELLNSAYKKGTLVKRMVKRKTIEGEQQVPESFDVYRPIVMANISGMEDVLGDRCLSLTIDKSNKKEIINLIELFDEDDIILTTTKLLKEVSECRLCRCRFSCRKLENWNKWIKLSYNNNTNNTHNTYYTYNTNNTQPLKDTNLYELIFESGISGRNLELSFPLILISDVLGTTKTTPTILKTTLNTLSLISKQKMEDEFVENSDISLLDFISQEPENLSFISVNELLQKYKDFVRSNEEWINVKWLGRALKRLDLIVEKRRKSYGREILLNIKKAQNKIKMFK